MSQATVIDFQNRMIVLEFPNRLKYDSQKILFYVEIFIYRLALGFFIREDFLSLTETSKYLERLSVLGGKKSLAVGQ